MALTPYPSRAARLSASVDKAFGELFTFDAFKPGEDVNGRKVRDFSRASFSQVGIWKGPAKSTTIHARASIADDSAHNWTASRPSVSVADAQLVWLPRPGDKVTRQFDGQFYEVARTYPDSKGRVLIQLTAKKRWIVAATAPSLRFNDSANSQLIPLI